MIETRQLTKRYGDLTAVDNISFKVETGQVLGFLGPNGAGKSTTMKMIAGFLAPSSGSASVCGFDVGAISDLPVSYTDLSLPTPNVAAAKEAMSRVADVAAVEIAPQDHRLTAFPKPGKQIFGAISDLLKAQGICLLYTSPSPRDS